MHPHYDTRNLHICIRIGSIIVGWIQSLDSLLYSYIVRLPHAPIHRRMGGRKGPLWRSRPAYGWY
jgi:hypothetical protein